MREKETKYEPFDAFTEFCFICGRVNNEYERQGCIYPEAIREAKRMIDVYYSNCELKDDELFLQYAFVCNSSAFLRRKRKKGEWIFNRELFNSTTESLWIGIVVGVISLFITDYMQKGMHTPQIFVSYVGMMALIFFTYFKAIPYFSRVKDEDVQLPTMYDHFLRNYELRKIKAILRERKLIESTSNQVWRVTKWRLKAH